MRTRRDQLSEPIEVSEFVRDVGQRIRLMRLARKLTQADLAERADMSRQTVMAIEGGSLSARFSDVSRLLWALDDRALQDLMASAAGDTVYQEAAKAAIDRRLRKSAAPSA